MRPRVELLALAIAVVAAGAGCGNDARREPPPAAPAAAAPPNDAAHQALMGPHGDHSPRHGGTVLMYGDVHYEIVLSRSGSHQIWFSDAVRNELPASVASTVTMAIARPNAGVESLAFAIDDSGEAWRASGRPLRGDGEMITVRFALQGEPHEVEMPVAAQMLR